METFSVGIDVSKDRLDVFVRPSGEAFTVDRSPSGLGVLVERLAAIKPRRIALEATGGYETVVTAALAAAGLPVVVVNPAQVRSFAKALGKRAKTDPIHAAVIAHFAEAIKPEIRPLPDEKTQMLADLVQRRRQIIGMIAGREPTLEARYRTRSKRSILRLLKALEEELASVNADINDTVRSLPGWQATARAPHLRPRHRLHHRQDPDRRAARTRHARPQADRQHWWGSRRLRASRASRRAGA